MRGLFRRRPKGWLTVAEYRKLREREMQRRPDCVARELEQASLWSLREAERKLREGSHHGKEKENSG
jgi:hypothetical protein